MKFLMLSGLIISSGCGKTDEINAQNAYKDPSGTCLAALTQMASPFKRLDSELITQSCPGTSETFNERDSARFLFSAGYYRWIATTSISINGVVALGSLKIAAPTLTLAGYVLVQDGADITCTTCNFDYATFVGSSTWTVNGKTCKIENNRLVCPENNVKQL